MIHERMQRHRISIRIFKAISEPHTCLDFMRRHQQVLSIFGIQMITSNNNRWASNPGIYAIVAESMETGEMMAGIRIQLARGNQELPVSEATGYLDPRVYSLVEGYDSKGSTGEITALWNSRDYKGIGLSTLLITTSTAVLDQLNMTSLLGLCDTRNIDTMKQFGGYEIERSIGEDGYFYYPKQGLKAWAIILKDPETVKSASEDVRKLIFGLRENPVQRMTIQKENCILDIDFKLKISSDQLFVSKPFSQATG